jgi:hypothetical protein
LTTANVLKPVPATVIVPPATLTLAIVGTAPITDDTALLAR